MGQNIIVAILFLAALGYLFNAFRNEFTRKKGCKGCGTCSTDSIEKITREIEKNILKN